jgi:diaminopimelate decarboxylase
VPTDPGEGAFALRDGVLHCEGLSAERLAREHGTPLYVYSRRTIETRYRAFDAAFADVDRLIAYSVKANGNLSVLALLGGLGAGADIVSGGELFRARRAGIPAARIVFSGVGKTVAEMADGLDAGILAFNVESEGELRQLSAVADAGGARARIALRVNPDIETPTPHHYTATGHADTKFGIPFDAAAALYRLAARLPGIEVAGIDVHIGSQILDVEPYRRAFERVLGLVDALRAEGIPLAFFDAGGGYGVAYDGGAELAPAAVAAVLAGPVRARGLRLILEPGRTIVAPAGILLTRVLYVKRTGARTFVITDAGMNDLLRPSHYDSYHRIEPVTAVPGRVERRVDVVGPICESGDFLALDRALALPEPGELLAVHTVGAYGFAMASTYNARPRPAEVMVDGDAAFVIRARERYADLVRGEDAEAVRPTRSEA